MDKRTLRTSFAICILFSVVVIAFSGCNKKEETVPNIDITNFSVAGGQIRGGLKVTNDQDVAEKGVVIGSASGPSIDNNSNSTAKITIDNNYYLFDDLILDTTYYVRGYTKSKKGVIKYSDERSFITQCLEIDSIIPRKVTSNTTQIVIYGRGFSNVTMNNSITIQDCLMSGSTLTKGPMNATSTSLTVDVTNVFVGTNSCESYISVDKSGDVCNAGGDIQTIINGVYGSSGAVQDGN